VTRFPRFVRARPGVAISHVTVPGERPMDSRFSWEQRTPTSFATHGVAISCRRTDRPTCEQRLARFLRGLAEMGFVSG
jgi:hypothetical protein